MLAKVIIPLKKKVSPEKGRLFFAMNTDLLIISTGRTYWVSKSDYVGIEYNLANRQNSSYILLIVIFFILPVELLNVSVALVLPSKIL